MATRPAALLTSVLVSLTLSGPAFAQRNQAASDRPTHLQISQGPTESPSLPAHGLGVDLLSDPQSVDFNPYMKTLVSGLKASWNEQIHGLAASDAASSAVIRFTIRPDGSVSMMHIVSPSGDVAFDRAAWSSLTQSAPFQPLPKAFTGPALDLQVHFQAPRKASGVS